MISKMLRKQVVLSTALIALMAAAPAFAADGDKTTIKGHITSIRGDTIIVTDGNNATHTITVSPSTTYKKKKGLAAIRFEKAEKGALLPGLPIIADGTAVGTGLNASAISFESEEHRVAQQVQAGTASTNARMNDFGTYEALATAEVLFASGSTAISEKGKSDLLAIARKSKDTKDYRVVVQGFTDSTGDPAKNQALSTRRATAVINFLQQKGGLSPGRVQAADGMGVAPDAGSGSNAAARKVVVRLVVDKGVNGGK